MRMRNRPRKRWPTHRPHRRGNSTFADGITPHARARARWHDKRTNGPGALTPCGTFALIKWFERALSKGIDHMFATTRVPFTVPTVDEIIANMKETLAKFPPAPLMSAGFVIPPESDEPHDDAADATAFAWSHVGKITP